MYNIKPIFGLTPFAAAINLPMMLTYYDLIEGGANGSRITALSIKAFEAFIDNGIVKFYLWDGATNYRWREFPVTATTPSSTVKSWEYYLNLPAEQALILAPGWTLRVARDTTDDIHVTAYGFHY